jgi:hypothetical protein
MTEEDEEFKRIERESGWRKRQIMTEDDDDIQDYKKPWVGLTAEEREQLQVESYGKVPHHVALIAAVEAKLKEKNS